MTCKSKLQQLAEYGHRQQEELLQRQKHLQRFHDRLMENSQSILAAQVSLFSKLRLLESVLIAYFFILLTAIIWIKASKYIHCIRQVLHLAQCNVAESRLIKVFFIYFTSIFIIYMFSSTKQTCVIRPWLYIGSTIFYS